MVLASSKVLLINPPTKNFTRSGTLLPPLGLAYVASSLRKNRYDVQMIDSQARDMNYDQIKAEINECDPDVVGITCNSFTYGKALEVVRLAKKTVGAFTILGGPHPSAFPLQPLDECDELDATIIGEGEESVVRLMHALEARSDLEKVPGIGFRKEGSTTFTPAEVIKDLDTLPFPAWDLLPLDKYWDPHAKKTPIVTMLTSRGCPYHCAFCGDHIVFTHKVRTRSWDNVVDEIEYDVKKFGIREISFVDSIFTLFHKRVMEICEEIIARNIKVNWFCNARVNTVSESLLRGMRSAGCHRIYFGVESGSQSILNIIRKELTLQEAYRAIALAKKTGIHAEAGFVFGFPGEGIREIVQTVKFAKEINPDSAQFSLLSPLPGTSIFNELKSRGIDVPHWDDMGFNNPKVSVCSLSVLELKELQRWAYRKFYFRFDYLLSQLAQLRSLEDVFYNTRRLFRFINALTKMTSDKTYVFKNVDTK